MAFSLIYPGSTNNATVEIRNVFGYSNDNRELLVWEDISSSLMNRANGACRYVQDDGRRCYGKQGPMLHIANSIWLDNYDTLDVKYAQIVGGYSKQVDFQSIDSPSVVNEWVSNQTDGLVNSIVQEDMPLPGLLIAFNSLYLKAMWDKEFMDVHTNLDKFYASPSVALQKRGGGGSNIHGDDDEDEGVVSMAHFMHNIETLPYSHTIIPGYQIVQKGFASSNSLSMIFVLPMNDNMTTPSVPSSKLIPAISNLQETRVAISLPKFKFESVYDDKLKNALQTLGIVSPFQGGDKFTLWNIWTIIIIIPL